jgi:thiamine kinase-like enzyme
MIAVRKDKSLLAFDAVFPQRDSVLCSNTMRENFSKLLKKRIDSCEIVRVKYRPQTSLRVLYNVKIADENSLFTARVFAENRSREVFQNTGNKAAILHSEKLKTVFWKFPFDRQIKNLSSICENNSRHELVAYAPEKCATFRYLNDENEPFAYAKIFADPNEGERIFSVYKQLAKGADELFPNAVCYSNKDRMLLVEAISGARLADVENKNPSNSFQLFGAAVARFHNLKSPEDLKEFTRHKPEKITETLEIIKFALPAHFAQAANLARKLTRNFEFEPAEKVTLHGDVHSKNAIIQAGAKLTLIDLDQASFGNAASDIGSFLGGLFYKEITGEISAADRKNRTEKFLGGYGKARSLPSAKSVQWHTAAAIFTERGGRTINRFRAEGLKNFGAILVCGRQILEGETR